MIAAHLRRFNQNPEWDVRQVLPIRGFLMSAPHLHHSDKKLDVAPIMVVIREFKEFKEFREFSFKHSKFSKFIKHLIRTHPQVNNFTLQPENIISC